MCRALRDTRADYLSMSARGTGDDLATPIEPSSLLTLQSIRLSVISVTLFPGFCCAISPCIRPNARYKMFSYLISRIHPDTSQYLQGPSTLSRVRLKMHHKLLLDDCEPSSMSLSFSVSLSGEAGRSPGITGKCLVSSIGRLHTRDRLLWPRIPSGPDYALH